jgi:hypothetical protein
MGAELRGILTRSSGYDISSPIRDAVGRRLSAAR